MKSAEQLLKEIEATETAYVESKFSETLSEIEAQLENSGRQPITHDFDATGEGAALSNRIKEILTNNGYIVRDVSAGFPGSGKWRIQVSLPRN